MIGAVEPDLFRALSDPNRRRILELLNQGERPVRELVGSFDITFGAVSQHLRILREAGLVERRKEGRQRVYRLRAESLKHLHDWTAEYEEAWRGRFDRLRSHLEEGRQVNLDVSFTETFPAPPEDVWAALTDRVALAEWLMPNDFVPEVGRSFTFEPDHDTPWDGNVECTVLELVAPEKMVWSWKTRGMSSPSQVEFRLEPKGGGTELAFRHRGQAHETEAEGLKGGWPERMARLASILRHGAGAAEKNKEVVRRLYAEVMGKGNMKVADEIFDPRYVDHMPIMETPDRAGLLKSVDAARRAFPDVEPRIIAEIAEGPWVAIAVEVDAGTHQGSYMGVPPSGKPVTWTETHFWRVENGKIVEHFGNVSLFEIHKMIGSHELDGTLA